MPSLIVERDGPIATIRISNPAKYNAMTLSMWQALPLELQALDADPGIRVIVLEGDGGKAFVSGADISELERHGSDAHSQARFNQSIEEAYLSPTRCSKPVVAKIRGICMGGGLGLAAACDMRICTTTAKLTTAFSKIGASGDYGGSYFLTKLVGEAKARELYFTADVISGEQAAALGIVNEAVAPDKFQEAAKAKARYLAGLPTVAIGYMKKNLNLAASATLSEVLDMEAAHMVRTMMTDDHKAASLAFVEKRPPVFKGY